MLHAQLRPRARHAENWKNSVEKVSPCRTTTAVRVQEEGRVSLEVRQQQAGKEKENEREREQGNRETGKPENRKTGKEEKRCCKHKTVKKKTSQDDDCLSR